MNQCWFLISINIPRWCQMLTSGEIEWGLRGNSLYSLWNFSTNLKLFQNNKKCINCQKSMEKSLTSVSIIIMVMFIISVEIIQFPWFLKSLLILWFMLSNFHYLWPFENVLSFIISLTILFDDVLLVSCF